MSGFVQTLRFGAAVVLAVCVSVAVLVLPERGSLAQGAKGKDAEKAFVARAVTKAEAEDDKFLRKLAYGDQKVLSKCIELSLKSKVVEENQGGLLLMLRLDHFIHARAALKFLDSENEMAMSIAALVLCRVPDAKHLSDFLKKWDKLETDKSSKAPYFRAYAQSLNLHPEALKQLLTRAKQSDLPEQATAALVALNVMLDIDRGTALAEVESRIRNSELHKSIKNRSQLHKPQSSSMLFFHPGWDTKVGQSTCGGNWLARERQSLKFSVADIERGEKQGFDILFKILIENDDDEILIGLLEAGAENVSAGTVLTATSQKTADREANIQAKGKWVELRFAWVPWRNIDGNSAFGSIGSEGFGGGGRYRPFGASPPTVLIYPRKGRCWVSRGELIRIDRLP